MTAPLLPRIPVIDARAGLAGLAEPQTVRALRDAAFGPFKSTVRPVLPLADRLARRWLARSASPYLSELDWLSGRTGVAGLYAINISYEYGCTTLASAGEPGRSPTLRRTLDWPFLGLGRSVVVAHRSGPAGDFFDVTWPGAVGVLTAVAPGRFGAAINQAPVLRRTRGAVLRPVDFACNLARTLSRERGMPPLHLLRHVFETAVDFEEALALIARVEIARPALFTLIGCGAGEAAIVERREREATVHSGPGSVANDWRVAHPDWEPRRCALDDHRLDSAARRAAIEERGHQSRAPFDWVAPPVRNWNTRLAVELSAGEGFLRVLGFEPIGADAAPATEPFERRHGPVEAAVA